jgi:hypothetical protein
MRKVWLGKKSRLDIERISKKLLHLKRYNSMAGGQ